jgi:hypothetical protein
MKMSKKYIKYIIYIIIDMTFILAFLFLTCDMKSIKDIFINSFLFLFLNIYIKDVINFNIGFNIGDEN